jgi:hypothetical protein
MALLTAIVGGFAAWNYKKVTKAEQQISAELRKLKLMQGIALQEDFKGWVARDREGKATGDGSPSDFQAMMHNGIGRNSLNLKTLTQQSARELRSGGTELTYRVSFEGIRVQNLIRFLVGLEESWPGARVKQIVKLDQNNRTELWDAVVDMSIFRSEES